MRYVVAKKKLLKQIENMENEDNVESKTQLEVQNDQSKNNEQSHYLSSEEHDKRKRRYESEENLISIQRKSPGNNNGINDYKKSIPMSNSKN